MNIGILIGEIGFISRYKIIDGIRDRAVRDDANITLYTCEGFLYEDLEDYIKGEYNIYNLPCLNNYDGLIVDIVSIQSEETRKMLEEKIVKSGVPYVSFDRRMEGAGNIIFNNSSGLFEIVSHLVKKHGFKDIAYLSGPSGNRDAIERKNVFLEAMEKLQLKVSEERLYEGCFDFESGRNLARMLAAEKINGKTLPEAIVCANDYMAIGLMNELKKFGITVPEDLVITGYDNCELAPLTSPKLTTVDRREYYAGQLAYDELIRRINGDNSENTYDIEGEIVISESCGCFENVLSDLEPVEEEAAVNTKIYMDASLDLIKGISIEIANMETLQELERSLEKYISRMGVEFFYFCQCGSRESYYLELDAIASGNEVERDVTKFSETAWCPIAFENGEWASYSCFDINELFPTGSKYKKNGSYYIVMPVHQGVVCIGYIITGNFSENLSGRVIQHMVLNIDQAIGNIRKQDIMKTMLAKINQKWQYDQLTGLYNRSGLHVKTQELVNESISTDKGIVIIFFDLDGLKKVNDTLGHEAGDKYIKMMADMLISSTDETDITVRYGGDEYVVLSIKDDEAEAKKYYDRVISGITEPVKTSHGYAFGKAKNIKEIKKMIEEADEKMYMDKIAKKQK